MRSKRIDEVATSSKGKRVELERRKGRRQKGKGGREGYNEKNKSEETKGDLGSGKRMDKDLGICECA